MPMVRTGQDGAAAAAGSPTDDALADFSAFYRAEHAAVVGTIYALTGDWARAEELAQDVFVSAHRHWERVLAHPRPDLWVRRAAVNRSTSWFRRRRVEQLTKAEAAHVLGCSESTLRTHLQRGRAALRARIEEEGPDA